jgi:hypothetical protein
MPTSTTSTPPSSVAGSIADTFFCSVANMARLAGMSNPSNTAGQFTARPPAISTRRATAGINASA